MVGQGQGVSYDPVVPLYRTIPPVAHELGWEVGLVVAKRWECGPGRWVQGVYFRLSGECETVLGGAATRWICAVTNGRWRMW